MFLHLHTTYIVCAQMIRQTGFWSNADLDRLSDRRKWGKNEAIKQDLILQASSSVSFAASNTIGRPLSTMILLLIIAVSWFLLSDNSLRQCLLSNLWAVALHLLRCQQQNILSSSCSTSCFICSLVHTSDHSQQGLLLPWYWSSWIYFCAVAFLPGFFFSRTSACCGQPANFIRRDQNCSTTRCLCSRKDMVVVRQKCAVASLGQRWDKWAPCVPSKACGLPCDPEDSFLVKN